MGKAANILNKLFAVVLALSLCVLGVPVLPVVASVAYADEPAASETDGSQETSSSEDEEAAKKKKAQEQDAQAAAEAPNTDPTAEAADSQVISEQDSAADAGGTGADAAADQGSASNGGGSTAGDTGSAAGTSGASRNGLSTETDEAKEAASAKSVEQAQDAYDKAYASAVEAVGQLGSMAELQANLAPYFEKLASAWDEAEAAKGLREPLEAQRKECEAKVKKLEAELEVAKKDRAEALYGLLLVDRELSQAGGEGLVAVLVGTSNATEAEASEYLLERIAVSQASAKKAADAHVANVEEDIAATIKQISDIDKAIKEAEAKKRETQEALEAVVDEGNKAAFAIEKLASAARQVSKEAITSVEHLSDKIDGVKDLKESAKEWDLQSNGVRADALAQAGLWYDTVDSLVGLEGAISYGCGLDFALDEDAFVEKWGTAIDTFFVAQGAPLQGYGAEMARQAYAYKIDPRLCAAVSIVESSGGRFCIKPHNAWGWGAADSDPYNLASGWGSWEEAIEAWHRGMATSQTGLATTPSLTAMGDIYCSTPIWGNKVATLMEQISSYAIVPATLDASAAI